MGRLRGSGGRLIVYGGTILVCGIIAKVIPEDWFYLEALLGLVIVGVILLWLTGTQPVQEYHFDIEDKDEQL